MGKLLLILAIVCALFYFIIQKISKLKFNNSSSVTSQNDIIEINLPSFMLQSLLKKTLTTVGIGFLILLITLVLASKVKIVLILLPISFYLIAQFFVFNNHLKVIKNQKVTYNRINSQITILNNDGSFTIDLKDSNFKLKEFKSVQKNNGIMLGYYELISQKMKFQIPFIIAQNIQTKPLFDKFEQIPHSVETKLFPII